MSRYLLPVFRWGIFVLACVFLYTQLQAYKGSAVVTELRDQWPQVFASPVFLAVVGLVFVNWWVESMKWRRLVTHVAPIGPWRAFLATVAGTSVGLVTPNRTGEFVGRVLFLPPDGRVSAGFATALGSIAQFVITLVMGGLGLVAMLSSSRPMPWSSSFASVSILVLTLLVCSTALVLFFRPRLFRHLLMAFPFPKRLHRASAVLGSYAAHELMAVLGLGMLRYCVFAGQFVLLLIILGSGLEVGDAIMVVPIIYLVSTLVPTMMLTELGVRGTAAVAFTVPLGGVEAAVLMATFTLWVINLVLPACIGSLILLTARIRTRRT